MLLAYLSQGFRPKAPGDSLPQLLALQALPKKKQLPGGVRPQRKGRGVLPPGLFLLKAVKQSHSHLSPFIQTKNAVCSSLQTARVYTCR